MYAVFELNYVADFSDTPTTSVPEATVLVVVLGNGGAGGGNVGLFPLLAMVLFLAANNSA